MSAARTALRLGALLGLAEALPIVAYDLVMDDPRPARLLLAAAWALAIVATNAGWLALLSAALRGRPGWALALHAVLVGATRAFLQDRFELPWLGLLALAVPAGWLIGRAQGALAPRLAGLAVLPAAALSLLGRVPVFGSPPAEAVSLLLPGALAALAAGALGGARPMFAATALVSAALIGFAALRAPAQAQPAPQKNVLFVLVDTLRQDHVAPWGGQPTPSTARLAAEGVAFDEAITVIPKTTQSVAAYHTGKYPIHNGVRVLKDSLLPAQITLAERFADAGYDTAAFVHNGWVMRGRGFEQGFQQFWSFYEVERAWGPLRYTGAVTVLDTLTLRAIRPFDGNTDATVLTARALDWLDAQSTRGRPFFAYLHYFDPHWPYRPPGADGENMVNNIQKLKRWSRGQMIFANPLPARENEAAISLYGQEVVHNADAVGTLLDWLDARGLTDDTIVVFTADHGHHLGDHDYWYHHGEFLYEPGVRVPLLIRAPGQLPAGAREPTQFRSVDLAPTLLSLAGLPGDDALDGRPLARLQAEGAPPAFLETDISYFKWNKRRKVDGVTGKVRGVRFGRWKLHYTPQRGPGGWELYDLAADPTESTELLAAGQADPAVVLPLLKALADGIPDDEQAALEAMGNRFDTLPGLGAGAAAPGADAAEAGGEASLTESERAMLEALGYVED